ncbi:MAG: rRNA cytosine-C5-methyltransferase, partial [Nocardioidaceae bacterium]|nr:rRNA cytosine-C5-methyltransferase [Nocardioidaceae bacterium]
VQDEGSQLVAIALNDAIIEGRDDRWLDLCAGPGGKAALLAALAHQRGAHVTANEPQHHRADLVRQSLQAFDNVTVTEHDGRHGPWQPGTFDRILVDAPCTGLGALRRRPESRWRRTPGDLDQLVPLQSALLDRALELVRPGGVVAYATCSPHVAETSEVVDAALAAHTDVSPIALPGSMPEQGDRMQLWPHKHGTDAMFTALLRKTR